MEWRSNNLVGLREAGAITVRAHWAQEETLPWRRACIPFNGKGMGHRERWDQPLWFATARWPSLSTAFPGRAALQSSGAGHRSETWRPVCTAEADPGITMAEWATALRESYRRLQRAMARQRQDLAKRDGVSDKAASLKSRAASHAASHRDTDVTWPRASGDTPGSRRSNPGRGAQERPDDPRTDGYGANPRADSDSGQRNNGEWTEEDWTAWRQWRYRRDPDWDDSGWWQEDDIQWDQSDLIQHRTNPPTGDFGLDLTLS